MTSTCTLGELTRNPEEEEWPRLLGIPSVVVFYATSVPAVPKRGLPIFTNCREGFFSETCIFRTLGNYAVGL